MNIWRKIQFAIVLVLMCGLLIGSRAASATEIVVRHPVLLISIDGLRPDAVLEADKYGLKIPVLRSFLIDGSYAQAVINVNPTVTNPNHTTLVTGVLPVEHGILNNRPFAPTAKLPKGYSHYSQIRATTLWGAAKAAGLNTGSIFWPVTQMAADIDFNLVEGDDEDDAKIAEDAITLIEQKNPKLLTVHFVRFDHQQHEFGPFSAEGNAALEQIDAAVGRVVATHRNTYPDGVIAIASDHGFDKVTHQVNLNAAFVDAGFIELRGEGDRQEVASWKAFAWYVGGSAMIVFRDSEDIRTKARVSKLLKKLAADPANGIERVYTRDEYADRGLSPTSEAVVAFKSGYRMGNAMTGPLVIPSKGGAHGAYTTRTARLDMHSSFFITGPGIAAGKNLGIVDMLQIAPTLAAELGVSLPAARASLLPIRDE